LHFIFPTIAVQLARRYTEFRSIFVPLVHSDPEIVDESLYNQMKKLIVEPLEESSISTVIVIDALDECEDVEPASAILTVLGQSEAFGDDDPEDDPKVRSVLGVVILAANPLSPSTIGTLLGYDAEDVLPPLSSIHSLLTLQEDTDQPVRSFHKSFPDFIVDPARCVNQRFRVPPPNHHMELLISCLNLMNRTLEKNMCRLPDAVTNSEVPNLRERTERYINSALQYACKSWHKHLINEHTVRTPEITSALHRFLENKFVFWLEVLSVLGAAREAVDALDLVTKWLEVCHVFTLDAPQVLELASDCFRFVTGFFQVIEESAPHIYHSALLLSPQKSMVRRLYERHANPLTRIVHGLPVSWDPAIVTMETGYSLGRIATWSPCGRFIAISNRGSRAEILDAVT
ncbi:hypothetical protein BDM02DRAFT_3065228, partial [Thelephora ganbajun]